MAEVVGDPALLAVARQSLGPDYAVVVLYSTPGFSDAHKTVLGSHPSGTAASMGMATGDLAEEKLVADELLRAFVEGWNSGQK